MSSERHRPMGFAPDSAYSTWTKKFREASDRMEVVCNHERTFDFSSCDSLRALAKRYAREVEDIEVGDLPDAKGARLKLAKARLNDVECEQEFRDVLTETWQASDDGTHCYTAFVARGGLDAVVNHGATPPSYALAVLLDYTSSLCSELTVLDWPSTRAVAS